MVFDNDDRNSNHANNFTGKVETLFKSFVSATAITVEQEKNDTVVFFSLIIYNTVLASSVYTWILAVNNELNKTDENLIYWCDKL